MYNVRNNKGFTLLEIVIVLIIVGVLASVAMPALFSNVEKSRSSEALNTLGVIKRAVESCAAQFNGSTVTCNTWNALGMADPSWNAATNASANFTYALPAGLAANGSYTLVATRSTANSGVAAGNTVTIAKNGATGVITRSGAGVFAGIQ